MEIKLRPGDTVTWKVGLSGKTTMIGVVMEELENGKVDLITHYKNGRRCIMNMHVDKKLLTLIY